MSKKRIKLTVKEHQELTSARDWCVRNNYAASVEYYDAILDFHHYRHALPDSPDDDDDGSYDGR